MALVRMTQMSDLKSRSWSATGAMFPARAQTAKPLLFIAARSTSTASLSFSFIDRADPLD
jgi:hypothetical protein